MSEWIQTFTGGRFWPLDPRPDDVRIEDIAHALSNTCRYTGHCRLFYSVAEHCVRVSWSVPPADALWGLLHDASEAYLHDLARPVKRTPALAGYREAEAKVMLTICHAYGLPIEEPPSVRESDNRMLMTERRDLMAAPPSPWVETAEPYAWRITSPWLPKEARFQYRRRFDELIAAHKPVRPAAEVRP